MEAEKIGYFLAETLIILEDQAQESINFFIYSLEKDLNIRELVNDSGEELEKFINLTQKPAYFNILFLNIFNKLNDYLATNAKLKMQHNILLTLGFKLIKIDLNKNYLLENSRLIVDEFHKIYIKSFIAK